MKQRKASDAYPNKIPMSFQSRNGVINRDAYTSHTLERQWATPFITEFQDGGLEPEVVIN